MKAAEPAAQSTPKVAPRDRLGAVVPELAPTSLVDADLRNVIVLSRRRRTGDGEAPVVEVNDNLRPVPNVAKPYRHAPWTVLMAAALLLHLALVLVFLRDPQPLPEAGLEAISVELEMIGNEQPVGVAAQPSEAADAPQPDAEQKPDPEQKTELARNEPETPVEPERQEVEQPQQEPKLAAAEPEPDPDRKPPETEALAVQEKPEPPRQEPSREAPKPEVSEQPKPQQPPQKKSSKKAAPAQTAQAGGIGAGQSAALQNYFSQVAQHLSRHKRFPSQAREAGHRGVATVSFTVDANGHVGAVSLSRSSGFASLDAETQAMVQRASPFPAPPSRQSMTFTVPVNFDLR